MNEPVTPEQPEQPVETRPSDTRPEIDAAKKLLKEYGMPLLIGVGIAVLALVGWTAFRNYRDSNASQAAHKLYTATTAEELQQVSLQYASTPVAPLAQLLAAARFFESEQYDMAQTLYDSFLRAHPEHPLAAMARLGQVQCKEAAGLLDGALAGYEAFLSAQSNSYLMALAVFGQARCLELMGRYDDARSVYEDFITAHTNSPWLPSAETGMKYVEKARRAAEAPIPQAETTSPVTMEPPVILPATESPVLPEPTPAAEPAR